MRAWGLAAAVVLGMASVAAAKDQDPQGQQEDKVVCKRQYDADTGSHFSTPKKVCLRKSEWKQMEDGAENSLRRLREQGGACPTCLPRGSSGPG